MATKLFKLAESPGSLNNILQEMYVYTQFSRMGVTYLDLLQFGHDGSDTYLQNNDDTCTGHFNQGSSHTEKQEKVINKKE